MKADRVLTGDCRPPAMLRDTNRRLQYVHAELPKCLQEIVSAVYWDKTGCAAFNFGCEAAQFVFGADVKRAASLRAAVVIQCQIVRGSRELDRAENSDP